MVRRGGKIIVIGMRPDGIRVQFDPLKITNKSLQILGSKMGSMNPRKDIWSVPDAYDSVRFEFDTLGSSDNRAPISRGFSIGCDGDY